MPASLLFPLDFQRQYAGPLDPDVVFNTTAERNAYLTNARRYAGMVVTDLDTEGVVYVLNGTRDTWLAIGAGGGELQLSATGTDNLGTTGLGSFAAITGGTSNIAIGRDSLTALTNGTYNIGIGEDALDSVTNANYNVAIGFNAGHDYTSGGSNVAIGYDAHSETSGLTQYAVVIGQQAVSNGGNSRHDALIAIGSSACQQGRVCSNFSDSSIAIGAQSMGGSGLDYQNTGVSNIAVGYRALHTVTSGAFNLAIGKLAGDSISTGSRNVAVGHLALGGVTSFSDNTAIGYNALAVATGGDNVGVGESAGSTVTGGQNVFLGAKTGSSVAATSNSIVIGWNLLASDSDQLKIGYNGAAMFDAAGITNLSTATLAINAGGGASFSGAVETLTLRGRDDDVMRITAPSGGSGLSSMEIDGNLGISVKSPIAFEEGVFSEPTTIGSGSGGAPNLSAGNVFNLTLTANGTLSNPGVISATAMSTFVVNVIQDASGGNTLGFGTYYKGAGGTLPTIASGANEKTLLCCQTVSATEIVVTAVENYS